MKIFISFLLLVPAICISGGAYLDFSKMSSTEYFQMQGIEVKDIGKVCDSGEGSTIDQEFCIKRSLEKSQQELDATYKNAVTKITSLDADAKKYSVQAALPFFTASQGKWLAYRESTCKFQYALVGNGSMRSQVYLSCLDTMTQSRIKEITEMLSGIS